MKFSIITLFPEMFEGAFSHSIVKRAKDKGIVAIEFVQLRQFAIDKHGTVDEKPYGGGTGMILMPKPVFDAVDSVKSVTNGSSKTILLTPRGQKLTQAKVKELSKEENLIIICPRYEGVDERVRTLADEELSIGDYILTGAEIPAMVLVDSITRLLEGVLIKKDATEIESFENGLLEYPQYTRPEEFRDMKVPSILLSGNHKEIEKWRNEEARKITQESRPDLLNQQ